MNISEGTFGNKSSNLSLNVNCYGRTSVYECDYSLVRNARPVQYNTAIHCPVPSKYSCSHVYTVHIYIYLYVAIMIHFLLFCLSLYIILVNSFVIFYNEALSMRHYH